MSWNMPDGATSEQYDRYCGYDQADRDPEEPDDYEDDYWEREDESCGKTEDTSDIGYALGMRDIKP